MEEGTEGMLSADYSSDVKKVKRMLTRCDKKSPNCSSNINEAQQTNHRT